MNSLIRSCTVVLLSTSVLATSLTNNDTLLDELRRPRVVGRIVKLYSGSKPDPVACTGEGYQADPADCAVFYRCIKGGKEKYTVFRFQCGPGTIYDPDTEICNHPKSTKRSECFNSIQEVNPQTELNENEIDFGNTNELPSPILINKPVYAAHNAVKRNDMTVTTVNPLKTTTKTLLLNQKPRHPNQEGDACTTDGFMGDSENCRKFYRCVGNGRGSYIRYEFSCSQTTVWDDEVQSCNHPNLVKRQRCGGRTDKDIEKVNEKDQQNTPDSDAKTIQEQIQINYGSKVSQSQVQINNGSAIQNQTQKNYGDRVNQSQRQENYGTKSKQNQKQITKGSAVSQTQTQVNYGGKASQSQVQIDHTKETSQTQTQASEPNIDEDDNDGGYNNNNQEKPQTTESNVGNSDEKQCTSSGFMGDPNNCKKFYRCVDNGKGGYTRYEFSCGDGTVWDPSIEGCNHAWAVKTCDEKSPTGFSTTASSITSEVTTETTPKTTAQPETTTQTSSTSGDDDDDTGYGNQNSASPPISTSVKPTDAPQVSTNAPQASTDETVLLNDTVCTHNGFKGDSSDCKKFYRCVDNGRGGYTKYEFSCGDGTVWDSEIEACNHAWAVQRCGGAINSDSDKEEITTQKLSNSETPVISKPSSTTETSELENTEVDNGYGQPVDTSVPVFSTTTEIQQTQSPGSTSNKECQSSGFMGDENNCKKFYRCVDDGQGSYTRYEFSCGEGTVWDQTIEGCNHVWAVKKCGGSVETQTQPQNELVSQVTATASSVTFETDDDQGYSSPVTSAEPTMTTQTSEPSKGKECTEEGFFGNENDCRKFYRCVDNGKRLYTKYEFTCGEGTVWDSSIKGCNHPSDSNKCGSSGGSSSSTASPSNDTEPENDEMNTEATSKATTTADTSQTSQPVTTEGPQTSTGTCQSEGFHPEPNDCKKFYRCVDDGSGGFTKYDFACGEGTVWDQNIQGCNHESDNKNCKSSNSNTDPQPNHETSTQQNQESSSQESTTKGQMTAQEETSTETQSTTTASGNQGECTSDGFYANPTDCKKFYRCVSDGKGGYTRYNFTCGEGTVWDQNIQGCNHESDSRNCRNSSSNTDPQENHETSTQQNQETSSQENTTKDQTTTQEETSTETQSATTGNQGECTSDGFYANPTDCKKFYRCVSDGKEGYTRYDFICGEGTVWVQEIQACDHDNDVNSCSSQNSDGSFTSSTQTPEQINTEDSNHQVSLDASTSTVSQTQADKYPTESPSSSSSTTASIGECNSEGFYGNENDCTKFYRCVDNGSGGYTKYDFTCGEGTAWDPNIQACNHKSEVDSCKASNEEKPGTQPMHDDPAPTTQSTTSTTTSSEYVSTTMTSTSGPYKNDSDSEKPSSKDECTKEGYYGNSQDCTKFYRCVDNGKGGFTKYDFQCGEGTIWDQDITACNHPNDVNNPSCNNQGQHTDTSSTISTTSSSQEQHSSTSQSTSSTTEGNNEGASNCTQEDSSKKPGKTKVNCTKAGFYPDPDNCKKFYRCVDWDGNGKRFSVFHFDCGEGTIWDPALDTCNYEDSVYPPRDCSGQETQSESTHETTTTSKATTTSDEPTGTTVKQQSSTTSQQITTQETTTQQYSTNEQTTTQKTTTQQITTIEQTTSEQSTTSEQTTTQLTTIEESPTPQQTTTEQSTTQQTTTEQSATSEQTTAAQPTSSEPTTTEQSTTSEQTTTEQPTSSESTTTEQSTTSEQTTTEQQTSNEPTTTEQSTTSEQTTTTQPTTNQPTTEQATTTEQSIAQESTTMQSTTTEETTTQQTTAEPSTTDSSTVQESTTQQQDTSTSESSTGEQQTTTEHNSSKPDKCPETDEDQYTYVCPTGFRRHPKYCNLFYQCTEDDDTHEVKVATFTCPNNTIYDESKTQCVEESKADKKCDGKIAQKRRVKRLDAYTKEPMVVSKEKHDCPAVGHFPFERQDECSPAFLKCERSKSGKVRGFVYQCPDGFVYWAVSRRCEPQSIMRSCKQTANSWSGRWEIPVERRNVAS